MALDHGCRLIQRGADFDIAYHASMAGDTFDYQQGDYQLGDHRAMANIHLALTGAHQADNAGVALAVIDELVGQGWQVSEASRREGLAQVRLAGRIEVVPGEPLVVLDTAHNAASAAALATTLGNRGELPRTLVVACSRDKDFAAIAHALVPVFRRIVVTQYQDNPRAVPYEQLAQVFRDAAQDGQNVAIDLMPTPADAWRHAIEVTPNTGLVCITGSFFLAAELRPVVLARRSS